MAKTQIADIIEPEIFVDSVVERTAELSRLFQSGIIQTDPEFDALASGKGRLFHMPFWKDLGGESEELDDTDPLDTDKIEQAKDAAHKHFRGKAWKTNDLAGALAGDDPMQRIVDLVSAWWARDMQKVVLLPSLQGVFATTLASTHVHDISVASGGSAGAANKISAAAVIEAVGKLGDAWEKIVAMAMHSVVFRTLQNANLIEFLPLSEQGLRVPFFLGREVIVDDGMPAETYGSPVNTRYTTYMFGSGSVGFGEGRSPSLEPSEAVETDRDTLAGDDIFVNRRHFILHPRGVSWVGTVAGVSPTKTELQTGASWSRVWEEKNVAIVALKTNG